MKYYIWLLLFCFSNSFAQDITFSENFLFGVSNAPAQVEESLQDPWMKFADEGGIHAFQNQSVPKDKIRFWSEYDRELELASELGISIFRMGVSWQRLMPTNKGTNSFDIEAIRHYQKMLSAIHNRKMKVMLTLFHHSLPDWAIANGGWTNPELIGQFVEFGKFVVDNLGDQVDYWTTFNEPNVYSMFSYVVGNWPGPGSNFLAMLNMSFYKGDFFKALDNMAAAHNQIYQYIHEKNHDAKVGVAHNTANYKDGGFGGSLASDWSWENMNWYFPDLIKGSMDFMGINYYGSEYVSLTGVNFSPEAEYNDAGRAIDPEGFNAVIKKYYERYQRPIFITENGTADAFDIIRPAYLIEHLVAVKKAMNDGVPVWGYIHWTLSDNLEWSDGYCPKFGLVAVDRERGLRRKPRESFYLYQQIIAEDGITEQMRKETWNEYKRQWGKKRIMCRAENGKDGLDIPREETLKAIDWQVK